MGGKKLNEKTIFIDIGSGFAVELRGKYNIDRMENLFSCKFEEKKKRYGFTLDDPKIDKEIDIWIAERWNLGG